MQASDSSIYQYIADRYSGVKQMIDEDDLPVLSHFVEKEYVCYDEIVFGIESEV